MSHPLEVIDLSKRFRLCHERWGSLKGALLRWWRDRPEELWVLRGVSFAVDAGEAVAMLGPNGTGKSTLLGLIARVYRPTSGKIQTRGRISTLLELGAGFHPELTGLENIDLNGCILGMSRKEIERKRESIIAFAELDKFIDVPLRNYSTGMEMRLGFSIAVHADPEILLVDEVLAVGDEHFQQKCYGKIAELQAQGCTILFVSHDMTAVRRACTRAIWLREGKVEQDGPVGTTVDAYQAWARSGEGAAAR